MSNEIETETKAESCSIPVKHKNKPIKKVKRISIISKYHGKMCSLTPELRCTVGMCSVAKCQRVQEISDIRDPVTQYTGRDYGSIIDRVIGKKK
jgi:hypothetical protein